MNLPPVLAGAWRLAEWGLSVQQRRDWITQRLALGISAFDVADLPEARPALALLGEALAQQPALRSQVQLLCTCSVARPEALLPAVQHCLQALRTDQLDMMLLHHPAGATWPPAQAMAEALQGVLRAGLTRALGVCNHSVQQLAQLHAHVPLRAHQVPLSLMQPEPLHDGTLAQCQALGLWPMAWAPLAGGRLFTGQEPAALRLRAALAALAADTGLPEVTLAAAWVMQQPGRPRPVLGSRRLAVAQQVLQGASVRLAPAQLARLSPGHRQVLAGLSGPARLLRPGP